MPVEDNRPGYYAIIPAEVRYDETLPASAKLLYGEISALTGKEGFCFAGNQYFAKLYGMRQETIARLVTKLEKAGHIKRIVQRDENHQVISRKLYLTRPYRQNCGEGIDRKIKDINTRKNKKEEWL